MIKRHWVRRYPQQYEALEAAGVSVRASVPDGHRFEFPQLHQPHPRRSPLSAVGDFGRLRLEAVPQIAKAADRSICGQEASARGTPGPTARPTTMLDGDG
jgi:hypothetical protein